MTYNHASADASADGGAFPAPRIALACALVAGVIASLVLVGWLVGWPLPRSWLPHEIEMRFNAAAAVGLLALALGLKGAGAGRAGSIGANLAAGVALAISLLTLAEDLSGRDLGIDQLIVADVGEPVAPGRMTLPAAVCVALLATAVLLTDRRRSNPLVGWLVLPTLVVGGMAFVGHLYAVLWLTTLGAFRPIAAPACAAQLALGAGLVAAGCPDWIRRFGPQARRVALISALLLLGLLGGAMGRTTARLAADNARVERTHAVLDRLAALAARMEQTETGLRGYLLTGDAHFAAVVDQGAHDLAGLLDELRTLVTDSPVQRARLALLQEQLERKLAANRKVFADLGRDGMEAARAGFPASEGRSLTPAIRRTLATMRQGEIHLLEERQALARTSTTRTQLAFGLGLALSLGLLVTVFLRLQQSEAELRRSEESLAVTLHSIGDAVLATDTAGRVTLLNPIAESLTGWTLAEARGRPVAEVFRIINEDSRAPAPIPVDDVLATGAIHGLANHTALLARDGREYAIEDSAAPIRDRAGVIIGVVLVFRDVTVTRRAQAELDRFFSLSLDFLCISSADGFFKRVSPGVTDMLGWSVDEFLATPFIDLVHPDDRAATQAEVERQMRDNAKVLNFENRYRHKDGSWRVLSWRSVPDRHSGLMYATARDVTERNRAAEELRQSRAELQSLFESLPGLYLVLTPQDRIVAASDAYLAATLTRREAIVGRGLFEVFPDNPGDPAADGARNLRVSLRRVVENGAPDTMAIQRYDIPGPDGKFIEKYWSPINSPLLGADGQLRYIIHRVEDVTEFVRQRGSAAGDEAGLRIRLQKMEAEVFESTRRVQAVNRQLESANQELEAFSYSVSHDLRAPLRHVQGYVEMLTREAQGGLSEKAQRYLRTIGEAAREMGQLIDDLLAFSRMGRTELVEAEVDLAALVAEVRRGLEAAEPDRPLEWRIGMLPTLRGDAAMLRQVLANLLGNAVKYTRGRTPAVIEVGHAGQDEGREVIFVRDNGAGFDMKYAGKLFGVFQRLHRADEFEGTGIGLASVRRIVARHGGRTWAEGEPGRGATFYFSLRRAGEAPHPLS